MTNNTFNQTPKNIAIVTGATGGLGRAFVHILNQDLMVDEVWAIARSQDNLNHLEKEFGFKIKTFSLDLALPESYEQIKNLLEQNQNHQVTYLINNAGYAKFGSYADLTLEQSLNLINVNCKAVVGLTLTVIPFMSERSHILNLASQAAFQPLPYLNIYAATKAFVKNYSRALNLELTPKNISVTTVCPGWINTNLINNAQTNSLSSPTVFKHMVEPLPVATKAIKDAQKNKDMSVYGFRTKISHLAAKLLPQKFIMKYWLHQQKIHN